MIVQIQGAEEMLQQIYYEFDNKSVPLGKGGMGVVYLGRCVSQIDGAYTPVAIKFITNDSEDLIKRAQQEASIQIDHPNLMRMWGFIPNMEWDPYTQSQIARYYIAMEYLEGANLDSVLMGKLTNKHGDIVEIAQNFHTMYENDVVEGATFIMKQVLAGVAALHDCGYVHRDIDPSNVMLTNLGAVKVIDFGIAKQLHATSFPQYRELTHFGTVMGKMDYASPEVVRGQVDIHNYSTDVYSLGIMFYRLMTGSLPFTGTSQEVMDAQVNKPVPVQNIPDKKIRKIIEKATQKEQSKRYQNAQEMLDELLAADDDPKPEPKPFPVWKYLAIGGASVLAGILLSIFI